MLYLFLLCCCYEPSKATTLSTPSSKRVSTYKSERSSIDVILILAMLLL
jgi:hypothetical protein